MARTPGLHPYSLREVPWDFNDHRESGTRFNVSSERRCLFGSIVSPSLYWGSLDLSWEFSGADGTSRSLGQGSVTGHTQASDGTFSQSSRLELDSGKLGLGRGGDVICVAKHEGGTRRAAATLNVIGELDIDGHMIVVIFCRSHKRKIYMKTCIFFISLKIVI